VPIVCKKSIKKGKNDAFFANICYSYRMHEYKTNGTCSTKIRFELNDGKIHSLSFEKGCDGNLKAISALLEGTCAKEAAKRLKGLRCDSRQTSCGDQLARAIESFL